MDGYKIWPTCSEKAHKSKLDIVEGRRKKEAETLAEKSWMKKKRAVGGRVESRGCVDES